MIWPNSITHAVYTIISSDSDIVSNNVLVGHYESFNTNRANDPFVNVMAPTMNMEPRRTNITQPWITELNIPVIVQGLHGRDRRLGQIEADKLVTLVMTAVNCNRSLLGQVENVTGFNIAPYDQENWGREDFIEDTFFNYLITINAEVFA